jgi:hypothetical protein
MEGREALKFSRRHATTQRKRSTNMKKQNSNGAYKIEKGIPLPVAAGRKFPLAEMKPGESFVLSTDPKEQASLRTAFARYGKGKRFAVRKWKDAYRCWCIK